MKNRILGTNSMPSTRRRRAGASSTTLLAVLLLLVVGGGVVAWLVLGGGKPAPIAPKPKETDLPPKTAELPKPEVSTETQGVESDDWNKQMEKAKDAPVKQSLFKSRGAETLTATLEGDVVD